MNEVLADLVHHHLHRLRFILRVDPDRLVEIHSLLAELIVINDHRHVIIHVLCIGPAQGQCERSEALELLRLGKIEFEIVPLSALLQNHQFLMRFGDGTIEFVAR